MESITAVIVEDLPSNQKLLKNLLETHCQAVKVVATAANIKDAVSVLREVKPQLVFLDIELPDGSGFDILNHFSPIPFKVIFVTAHQEYAYQAIKFHAVDFILKPISIKELMESVDSVIVDRMDKTYQKKIENVMRQLSNPDKITLMDPSGFVVVNVKDIIKLEANANYTHIFLTGRRKLSYCRILKEFADLLSSNHDFFRAHRSFLINLTHVKSFNNQGEIRLTEENTAHLGDSCRDAFMAHFKHQ